MAAKRVLYICPNSRRAGAEQVTALLMRHHDRASWEPEIYFFTDGPLVKELRAEGLACHLATRHRPPRLRNPASVVSEARAIASLIRRRRIDLVHSVMGYGHLFGGLAAKLAGRPEVWFQHGPTGPLDWLTGRVPSRLVLANSEFTAREQARYRAWTPRVRTVHLGVEPLSPEDWDAPGAELRSRIETDPRSVVFTLAGRISPMKGHLAFVDAAELVLRKNERARFWVVGAPFMPGDADFLELLRRSIAIRGLERAFHFTGHLSPVHPAIRATDVLVNASIAPEPFGLTVVEAMMLGRPVIAPDSGGPAEIIGPGREGGLLFAPGDAGSLAEAMIELLSEGARSAMGEQGRARALRHFHVERMVREIEEEYGRLFEGRGR